MVLVYMVLGPRSVEREGPSIVEYPSSTEVWIVMESARCDHVGLRDGTESKGRLFLC